MPPSRSKLLKAARCVKLVNRRREENADEVQGDPKCIPPSSPLRCPLRPNNDPTVSCLQPNFRTECLCVCGSQGRCCDCRMCCNVTENPRRNAKFCVRDIVHPCLTSPSEFSGDDKADRRTDGGRTAFLMQLQFVSRPKLGSTATRRYQVRSVCFFGLNGDAQ
jgi:hypothetical protein